METDRLLGEIVERIAAAAQPERIILFGSRARGHARSSSDYDLLVIQNSTEPRYRRAVGLYSRLTDLPAEVDIVVYTPGEVGEWSSVSQAFVTTAIREGRLLYERKG
jgi:predicted nucleotidyltransferase